MSKRLQVLLPDAEMEQIRDAAASQKLPVGEWVRRSLRTSYTQLPSRTIEEKLAALRAMSRHQLPTADIRQMIAEIESGYEQ